MLQIDPVFKRMAQKRGIYSKKLGTPSGSGYKEEARSDRGAAAGPAGCSGGLRFLSAVCLRPGALQDRKTKIRSRIRQT